MGKKPKLASKVSKPSKGKISPKPTDFFNKNKGIQYEVMVTFNPSVLIP